MIASVRFVLLLVTLLSLAGMAHAQAPLPDRYPKWEIGIEAIRVDFNCKQYVNGRYMNMVQPMPGFYLRRIMNRFSVRAGIQLGRLYFGDREFIGLNGSSVDIKALSIGFYSGVSYQLTKKAGWLHVIGDISWQNLHAKVLVDPANTDPTYISSHLYQNELFLRLGLNPRIPISRRLCIGTELTLGRGVRYNHHQWRNTDSGPFFNQLRTDDSKFKPMANLVVSARF